MANASYIQDSFIGGEKSQLAQGRIGDKEYRSWMNVCVNGHPTEAGGWIRRPGTMYAGVARNGRQARVIKFDFAASTPYTMEFSNRFVRFRSGLQLATTNDPKFVASISTANPAVVETSGHHNWLSGNTIIFPTLNGAQQLQNRQFLISVLDNTHFSLTDSATGATINGATISPFISGTVVRVQELVTPYLGFKWLTLRVVQAEQTAVLLQGTVSTQIITATTPTASNTSSTFTIAPLNFVDGPYLDPPTNGVQAVPNAKSGIITVSLAFPAWSATQAYQVGSFVVSVSVNYVSLINNNVGNTPASSPTAWAVTTPGAAINNGSGFLSTDVGRLIRLFSEPAPWSVTSTYSAGTLVSYNPTGAPGASTYWTSLVGSNVGNIPGQDTTHWQLTPSNAAIWSWGKVVGFANQILQSTGSPVGNMTQDGGIAAAFNGLLSQPLASSAVVTSQYNNLANFDNTQQILTIDCYVGKNFSSSPTSITSASIFPPSDTDMMTATSITGSGYPTSKNIHNQSFVLNLFASQTAPTSPSNGVLLGTAGNLAGASVNIGNGQGVNTNPEGSIVITSNDQVTTWNYVWVEFVMSATFGPDNADGEQFAAGPILTLTAAAAQVEFFTVSAGGTQNSVNLELLGPPLLYTNPCITWRLGAYSDTTGWPTNGTYHEGRIWLAGAIGNRFDASVSNGLSGTSLNMAPTDQNGVVGAANGISGVVNSDGVNPILWMMPDLQGIIMGSLAGEWLISAPSTGPLSTTNIFAHRVTKIGCANIEPRKSDHTIVFVQRYTKKVMEYFTDVYSGKFAAPNLAKDTMHITKPTVAEIAYTSATTPIIWGRNTDGSWWGATYKRDTLATSTGPTINGWHRHTLGSGRSVQSIAAGPSVGGNLDALTMVTLDASTGIYHVEIMTDAVEEGDTLLQATYLDDAVNPTSISSTTTPTSTAPYGSLTLNGLWHLNTKTVTAWLGGLDCGDYLVTNGSITVPYGDGISAGTASGLFAAGYAAMLSLSQMLVGFTYFSQGQIVRPATPAESGARNGPAVGKMRRNHKIAVQLEGTGTQVSFGYGFAKTQRDPAKFRQLNDVAYLANQQFTGVYKDTVTDIYSFDGMLCWQVGRPYPLNIANIGGFIETSDE